MIPYQITFRDFPESDAAWLAVQKRVEKLETFFDDIVRCEVVLSCPHWHRQTNRLYKVQIHISMPGKDVVISRDRLKNEAHRDIYVAIRDAFDAAERKLEDSVRLMRGQVKHHENRPV